MKVNSKHTEETKKKMSLAKKGKPSSWKGKHPSEESRLKMRLSHLGKKQSNETRLKRSISMKGKTHGFKKGQIAPMKGKKFSTERIDKMSKENAYNWKGGVDRGTKVKYAPRPKPDQCETCGSFDVICYDHDHNTGKFRGWICRRCNLSLGLLKDNVEILQNLIDYLNKNK